MLLLQDWGFRVSGLGGCGLPSRWDVWGLAALAKEWHFGWARAVQGFGL